MPEIDRSEGRCAFGGDPDGYNRARPGYPQRIYDILGSRCELQPGTRTFEIGPGTGQASRDLTRLGASPLVLIEPDQRLADFLRREFRPTPADSVIEVRNATFEDVDLPAASFDLGVAATSFHWLPVLPALQKVARLLRPGGWWAMWWTVFGDPLRPDAFHLATQGVLGKLKEILKHLTVVLDAPSSLRPLRCCDEVRFVFTTAGHEGCPGKLRMPSLQPGSSKVLGVSSLNSPEETPMVVVDHHDAPPNGR